MVAALCLGTSSFASAEDYFQILTLPSTGRTVAGELADLDGDGRLDVFVGVLSGIPPDDQRIARVYLQAPDGTFPTTPSFVKRLPDWSAVYDFEDVRPEQPGRELVVLLPDGVQVVSLASADAPEWKLTVEGATTLGPSGDERGLEPYRLVYRHLGAEPWILVPQVGALTALTGEGEIRARLEMPRRANFFVAPPTGLLSLESHLQIFLDSPKLLLGDIDGDGRNDIAAATRHEIWVYLQREDGSFAPKPDRRQALRLVTPRDHIRGSGGVSSATGDIDGDGRIDLVVSHISGGFSDATTTAYVHLNQNGGWQLDAPDQTIRLRGAIASNALMDLDRDGRVELVRLQVSFSLLEVVELLLSREFDIEMSIFRAAEAGGFRADPWVERKVSLPISFDTFRSKGFIPTARVDLNGDGYADFTSSGGGDELELYPGGPKGFFREKPAKQKMSTAGMVAFGDWSGDGLPDFLIFDPHNYDVPVRLGRNLGTLPGTPPGIGRRAR